MQFQKDLDDFHKSKGWEYWSELAILARLVEEVGEFAEAVNHFHGEKKVTHGDPIPSEEEEIGDIIYTLMCYANKRGFDLDECIISSMNKVAKRDKDRW